MGDRVEPAVECYAGQAYAERPLALRWNGQRLEVQTIEARWRSPAGPCFRVCTNNGQVFELC